MIMGPCDVCWTTSWVPVKDETECYLSHPHVGGGLRDHIRCDMCWLTNVLRETQKQMAELKQCSDEPCVGCIACLRHMHEQAEQRVAELQERLRFSEAMRVELLNSMGD